VVEEIGSIRLLKQVAEEPGERHVVNFEARVRYLASSLIVTIPVRVARELGLKLGDRVIIQVRMKEASPTLALKRRTSSL